MARQGNHIQEAPMPGQKKAPAPGWSKGPDHLQNDFCTSTQFFEVDSKEELPEITVHSHSDFRHTVVIPNATAQDVRLSWGARGLLAMMLSQPADWAFHEQWLIRQSPGGRDQLRGYLRELENHHYLYRIRLSETDGRRRESRWEVFAVPFRPSAAANHHPKYVASSDSLRHQSGQQVYPRTGIPSVETSIPAQGFSTLDNMESIAPQSISPQTENPSVDKTIGTTRVSPDTAKPKYGRSLPAQAISPRTGNRQQRGQDNSKIVCGKTPQDPVSGQENELLQAFSEKNVQPTTDGKSVRGPLRNINPTNKSKNNMAVLGIPKETPHSIPLREIDPSPLGQLPSIEPVFAASTATLPVDPLITAISPDISSEAPGSPCKAPETLPTGATTKGGSRRALPAFAEAYRESLEAWWVLRRQRHRASSQNGLTTRSLKALTYALDQGVLEQFCDLAAESGWISLGFVGHRDVIDRLAQETSSNLNPTPGHPGSRMVNSGHPFAGTLSRQNAAAERAKAIFANLASDPCSSQESSLTLFQVS